MFKYVIAAALAAALTSPVHAAGNWWKATSDHFIVYSQGKKEDAEQMAVDLERLDEAERYFRHLGKDAAALPTSAKLTVFQFGYTSDIGRLAGASGVAGFFIPRAGNSVAFVPLHNDREGGSRMDLSAYDLSAGAVLFHEYTHYFMFQHAAAAYPPWYIEGFAELFGSLQLQPNGFRLGEPPKHRQLSLEYLGVDLDKLLQPPEEMDWRETENIYAGGWLLTSYLTFAPERKGQLEDYLSRMNKGERSRQAAEHAFGDLKKLKADLDGYRQGRVRAVGIGFDNYSLPKSLVEAVPEDVSAALPLIIRSSRGVTKKKAPELVPDARRLVAQFPQSATVLAAAAEAELDAGNLDQAEALGKRALAVAPGTAKPEILLARLAMRRAEKDASQFTVARAHYAAANHADPKNAEALEGYYRSFLFAGGKIPDDALIALETAYDYAPFDDDLRQVLAYQLLTEHREPEVQILLGPLVSSAHSDKQREKFGKISEEITTGQSAQALQDLRPSLQPEADEE